MMKKSLGLLSAFLLLSSLMLAQIPKNDAKEFEYQGAATVKRAGSGELQQRMVKWANSYFEGMKVEVLVDDTTKRIVEVNVTESLVENYFGVNRKHADRVLKYHIKFDADRKDYKYWINKFEYSAQETDPKGQVNAVNGKLNELKTAANKSLQEEVHAKMLAIIESFTQAAEQELE